GRSREQHDRRAYADPGGLRRHHRPGGEALRRRRRRRRGVPRTGRRGRRCAGAAAHRRHRRDRGPALPGPGAGRAREHPRRRARPPARSHAPRVRRAAVRGPHRCGGGAHRARAPGEGRLGGTRAVLQHGLRLRGAPADRAGDRRGPPRARRPGLLRPGRRRPVALPRLLLRPAAGRPAPLHLDRREPGV
ncbi:MAG: hypothetical protein AVDCRST_MAG66-4258, partial [uncultured Pseudonocardia sp.]